MLIFIVRAAVINILSLGADVIKIALEPGQPQEPWPALKLEEVRTFVETAQGFGVPVRAHMQQALILDLALQAGVDVIEHAPLPFSAEIKLSEVSPEEGDPLADIEAMGWVEVVIKDGDIVYGHFWKGLL